MHARDTGPGSSVGPHLPILFLHGLGASGQDWEHQWPVVQDRHRLVSPDLRGHGHSGRGGPYAIAEQARDMQALLDLLEIPRCIVVGHSMGGAVAQELTLQAPDRVERLVVSNSLPSFRPNTLYRLREVAMRIAIVGAVGVRPLAGLIARRLFPHEAQRELRDTMAQRLGQISRQAYLRSLTALARWSALGRLGQIRCPVLLVAAEFDYFDARDVDQFEAGLADVRRVTVANSRHATPVDSAAEFNRQLLQFLGASRQPTAEAHGQ